MKNKISVINFVEEKIRYIFNQNEKYIKWPEVELYQRSYEEVPEHASAIGFILKNLIVDGIPELDFWQLQTLALDYLVYGSFGTKVVPLRNGTAKLEPIEISKHRLNPDKTQVALSEDWLNYKAKIEWYPVTPNGSEKGIFIFKSPMARGTYSKPYWSAALKSLDTALEISDYHWNNAKGGFTPNTIINFNNGEPDADTKKDIEKKIKEKFTGSGGQKFLIVYNDSKEAAVTIEKIENDNLDQKFETLQKFIQNQIIIAHQITSPQLIGVKADSQGFSKTEYEEAFTIFNEVVISTLRRELEYGLSQLLGKDVQLPRKEATI